MKKVSIILVIALTFVLLMSAFACDGPEPSQPDNPSVKPPTDGWVTSTATVEEAAGELIKTILNAAKTASVDKLSSVKPLLSWHISIDLTINGIPYQLVYDMNYDNRDPSETEMRILLSRKEEDSAFVSIYFYQDATTADGKTPGKLYVQYGEAKMLFPLKDTFLGSLFPISFGNNLDTLVTTFVGSNLFTIGDVTYKYKDTSDGKRTKNYSLQVDLKSTLNHFVSILGNNNYAEMSEPINWMIESIFGVEVEKINTQLPQTVITIDFSTVGGSKNSAGTGNIDYVLLNVNATEGDYKGGLFRGESYEAIVKLTSLKASSKHNEEFPKEDSSIFDAYNQYNTTALTMTGSFMIDRDEENLYDFETSLLYDGLAESQNEDKFSFKVTEKADSESIMMNFVAVDNNATFCYRNDEGKMIEFEFAFDIDRFIECIGEKSSNNNSSFDLLKIASFVLGSIQFWEDLSASIKVDYNFYQGILGLTPEGFASCLQEAYTYAGGTGTICYDQIVSQLGEGITLADILNDIIFTREMVFILDKGDGAFDTANQMLD